MPTTPLKRSNPPLKESIQVKELKDRIVILETEHEIMKEKYATLVQTLKQTIYLFCNQNESMQMLKGLALSMGSGETE